MVDADDGTGWSTARSSAASTRSSWTLSPACGRGAPGILLARRPHSVEGAVEGAFVLPRPDGGYALVLSYDSLFSTYHVRVGVSAQVTGPYADRAGRYLTDLDGDPALVGTLMLAGHTLDGGRSWLAPGHGSVLTDGDRQLLVHHVRDAADPTQHEVQVRPARLDRRRLARRLAAAVGGRLRTRRPPAHRPCRPRRDVGAGDVRAGDGQVRGDVPDHGDRGRAPGDVTSHGGGRFGRPGFELVVFGSVDSVRGVRTLSFAGLDAEGNATLGTRVGP